MRISLIIVLSLVVLGGIAFYYGKDLTKIQVEDSSYQIKSADASGFTIDVSLQINNPSGVNLKVQSIDYKATLRDTGEVIATGTLPPVSLPKENVTTVRASPRINWVPSANLVAEYATQEHVWMDLQLQIKMVSFLPPIPVTIPMDIKEVFDLYRQNPLTNQQNRTLLNGVL